MSCNLSGTANVNTIFTIQIHRDKYEENHDIKYTMEEILPIIGISWQESISLAQDICKHPLCGLAAPTPQAGVPKVQSHLTNVPTLGQVHSLA